jgi:nitrogen regulatory protein P-II 1
VLLSIVLIYLVPQSQRRRIIQNNRKDLSIAFMYMTCINMKQLDIIIPHERLPDVNNILYNHKVGGMLYYDIKGRGRVKREPVEERVRGYGGYATGKKYVPEFGTRTKIEVLVSDSTYKQLVDEILNTVSTGSAADGKIFIKDISEAYDIGSKQIGDPAL